jgi:hypothetical protein
MNRPIRKRFYRAAQCVIFVMFVLNLIAIFWLDYVLVHHRPTKPGGGFIIEYNNHGDVTFITNGDHQLFILLWVVPFVLLGIDGLLYQFNRPDWRRVAKQKTLL